MSNSVGSSIHTRYVCFVLSLLIVLLQLATHGYNLPSIINIEEDDFFSGMSNEQKEKVLM